MASKNGKKVLTDLDTRFIECRGPLRHAWYTVNPPEPKQGTLASAGIQESFRCERCGMEKHEVWGRRNGHLMTRQYRRPEGYAPIPRHFHAEDLRLELLKRWS